MPSSLSCPAPTWATERSFDRQTLGTGAGVLARRMHRPLMPHQQYVADVLGEYDDHGQLCYQAGLVTLPRQSGKTVLFSVIAEQRAMTWRDARCWFTMQTGQDARDWFLNEHLPLLGDFGGEVRAYRGAGTERVAWARSGGMFRPFPPTPDALHGKTADLVVVDETWAFDLPRGRELDQAIIPTMATRPNAQVLKLSTAGTDASTWLLGGVEAGRAAVAAGRTDGLAYFEWSCPDGLDPTDPAAWPQYHPAFGRTIGAPAMVSALELLGPDEFARAYGNRWIHTTARIIPAAAWIAAGDAAAPLPPAGGLSLGFDVAYDRSDAAIVAAWTDPSGVGRLEVAEWREGAGWVADRVVELVERWRPVSVGWSKAGPARDIGDELARRKVPLFDIVSDWAAACAELLAAVVADPPKLRYRPHQALDDAAGAATAKPVGDAWGWGRRTSSVSVAVLTAATAARWADLHAVAAEPFRIY
jgi:hypothetical protein